MRKNELGKERLAQKIKSNNKKHTGASIPWIFSLLLLFKKMTALEHVLSPTTLRTLWWEWLSTESPEVFTGVRVTVWHHPSFLPHSIIYPSLPCCLI